ncbi:prolyl oligopeptidase family serine peptidase [Psychromonas sp. Urea-02u-13]|uniref:prolyl oligopeptidase family serine peptidase n=1 Tax=Psychromonas sp. Urea-02u-13 TaxID=2058326 RepID=UPI0022B7FB52|nr:prolyl oligopeptidase family serine peptidase [Psychromonas sp. Urea-02u-13]
MPFLARQRDHEYSIDHFQNKFFIRSNILVTTALHDSQVQYREVAKWVAKLRELKTDDNQLLLYTDMESGHGGKSGRFKLFEDTAREFAFLIYLAKQTLSVQRGRGYLYSASCSIF